MHGENPIKVAIIKDQGEVREGLGYLIGAASGYQFTGGYCSLEEAVEGIGTDPPDILLLSPEIASRVVRLIRQFRPTAHTDYRLTPHETRLLALLVEGHSYKTAASELGSALNTVAFHMKSIYRKLRVHSKSEAVAKALREQLV